MWSALPASAKHQVVSNLSRQRNRLTPDEVQSSSMLLSLLVLLFAGAWAESFLYLHPANPEYHPRDMFPQQKSSPRGKIRDLPQSGIIYLNRIKPMDPFVKAFGSATEDRRQPLDIPKSTLNDQEVKPLTRNSIEEEVTTRRTRPSTTTEVTPADLSNEDVDVLDQLLNNFKSQPVDSKTGEGERKPPRLVSLRGTRVAGSASARHRPYSRQVKLATLRSTATIKTGREFDPWERMDI